MKKLRQYAKFLIAGMLLFFLIKPFVLTHSQLKDGAFQVHWQYLLMSFCLFLLYRSIYTAPFAMLLSGMRKKKVSFRDAFTLFHLGNITRYLPGRIWGVVRILSLSHRFGLRKTVVGSSLTLHVSIETVLGGGLAMSLIFSTHIRSTAQEALENISGHTALVMLCVCSLLAGVLFCIPQMARHARQFIKTLLTLRQQSRLWVNVLASHVLLWICQGLGFYLFVRGFTSVSWKHAGVLSACYAFSWVIGFLSFLTPGGLGIREGILGLLLANYMPAPNATLLALGARVWMLSTEVVLAAVAFCIRNQNVPPQTFFKKKL